MAEMNIKQIIDRLNAEFTGDTRKLDFWYDDKANANHISVTICTTTKAIVHPHLCSQ